MRSRRGFVIIVLIVVIGLLAAVPFALRYAKERAARAAVARYAVALDAALAELRPEALGTTALARENGRVTSYITLLWGRGVYVEAELIDMKVLNVRSTDPTVTAIVHEKWRFVEHDRSSRKQLGREEIEENTLRYTLLPGEKGLAVYLSEFVEDNELEKYGLKK